MENPDGMASPVDEREQMRRARNAPEPTHDIVAVSENGTELYITESCFSPKEAKEAKRRANEHLEGPNSNAWDIVDRFEIREREWDDSALPRDDLR